MKKKLKIALLISDLNIDYNNHQLIQELQKDTNIDLSIIFSKNPINSNAGFFLRLIRKIRIQGIIKTIEKALFKIQSKIELQVLKRLIKKEYKLYFSSYIINGVENLHTIEVKGNYSKSGIVVRYSKDDIEKIKKLDLDLILRINTPGIFKGEILRSSTHGIISFHHGDNRWNRGGPPGFWEVYYRKPATGFIIQILNEELDGGNVVYRGEMPTSFFYELNKFRLYKESYPFMYLVIKRLIDDERFELEEPHVFTDKLYKHPSFLKLIIYQWRLICFIIPKSIKIALKISAKWSVHFIEGRYNEVQLRKAIKIKNPKGRFFADPFVTSFKGRNILYVEDYYIKKSKAVITAVELKGNQYKILDTVIDEDFHLSYPFTFEYNNELYMVPESYNANSIRLYKCTDFPLKWEYQKDLIADINCADTNVFEYNGLWWLLTNKYSTSSVHSGHLFCFYTDDPIHGKWQEHKLNPVVYQNKARNGGWLENTDKLIRVSQKYGYNSYGVSLAFSKINVLDTNTYDESTIIEILPKFDKSIKGFHHMNYNGQYTVFDTLK